MHNRYRSVPKNANRRTLALIYTALIAILLLFCICAVELVMLASAHARLKDSLPDDPAPPADTDPVTPGDTTTPPADSTSTQVSVTVSPARLEETEDYGQEYINKIIFVGDSTTYGLKAYSMLSGGTNTKQVWTPASGTYSLNALVTTYKVVYPETGEELTVADAARKAKPEYMVITLGINYGVPYCGETEFKKYYRMLLDDVTAASPETKLMLQSIYPVATNNELKDITNEKIDLANKWIEQLAEEYGLKYLHTNPTLKGEDGYLVQSYQNGDGLHLQQSGFNKVLQFIRTHGYPQS